MDNNEYIVTEADIVEETKPTKGKNIAALILGIVSIVANLPVCPVPFAWVIALVTSIVSKCLLKNASKDGIHTGAKITSTIGLVLTIVWAALWLLFVIGYILLYVLVLVGAISMAGLAY
ncbi:MAG: hypothetical protein E7581_03155 [Ruminococcaceae bacterium]|nr:hypothetical protein [Oscillospiraceae bacterium]